MRPLVLTPNLDRIGFMPCNPSIGGPAKGHIVADVDALGGHMAEAIDRTALQIRTLNTSKGPAVQALRAQADKALYAMAMKEALEAQPGLEVVQDSARRVTISRAQVRRQSKRSKRTSVRATGAERRSSQPGRFCAAA
ncbi:MAG: FAD-dependent oxidoreductase [Thermomicrobiales bacterium]